MLFTLGNNVNVRREKRNLFLWRRERVSFRPSLPLKKTTTKVLIITSYNKITFGKNRVIGCHLDGTDVISRGEYVVLDQFYLLLS